MISNFWYMSMSLLYLGKTSSKTFSGEKGKELVRKRDTVCQFLRKKEAYFGLAGKYQCRAFFGGFCKSDE